MSNNTTSWADIAARDFVDNRFANYLSLNKALNAIQNSTANLDEQSYRTQAAIINGLLTHHMDLSDKKIPDMRKIAHLIILLDRLVQRASNFTKDGPADVLHLDSMIKSLLYRWIGDCILLFSDSDANSSRNKEKLAPLAYYAYKMAYEWAVQQGLDGQQQPFMLLNIIELHTLLDMGSRKDVDGKRGFATCNNYMLYIFVANYAYNNLPSFGMNDKTSFILNDEVLCKANREEFGRTYLDTSLSRVCVLHRNVNFLRRVGWILANSPDFGENYAFVDNFLDFLQSCPHNLDADCTPESLSCADIKIFLFRLSQYLKPYLPQNESIDYPWIFYNRPTALQNRFWDSIGTLWINREKIDSLHFPTLLTITNTIEQIRAPMISSTDMQNLIATVEFLTRMKCFSQNSKERAFYEHLATVYAYTTGTSLFESESKPSDEPSIHAHLEKMESSQPHIELEKDEENVILNANASAEFISESSSLNTINGGTTSTSTQTDTFPEIDERNALCLVGFQYLNDANFLIAKWTHHNRALQKLFSIPFF